MPFFIYESPYRVVKCLSDIASISPDATCVMGRELTKEFEEIRKESASSLLSYLEGKDQVKGEFVILVIPGGEGDDNAQEDQEP